MPSALGGGVVSGPGRFRADDDRAGRDADPEADAGVSGSLLSPAAPFFVDRCAQRGEEPSGFVVVAPVAGKPPDLDFVVNQEFAKRPLRPAGKGSHRPVALIGL